MASLNPEFVVVLDELVKPSEMCVLLELADSSAPDHLPLPALIAIREICGKEQLHSVLQRSTAGQSAGRQPSDACISEDPSGNDDALSAVTIGGVRFAVCRVAEQLPDERRWGHRQILLLPKDE